MSSQQTEALRALLEKQADELDAMGYPNKAAVLRAALAQTAGAPSEGAPAVDREAVAWAVETPSGRLRFIEDEPGKPIPGDARPLVYGDTPPAEAREPVGDAFAELHRQARRACSWLDDTGVYADTPPQLLGPLKLLRELVDSPQMLAALAQPQATPREHPAAQGDAGTVREDAKFDAWWERQENVNGP